MPALILLRLFPCVSGAAGNCREEQHARAAGHPVTHGWLRWRLLRLTEFKYSSIQWLPTAGSELKRFTTIMHLLSSSHPKLRLSLPEQYLVTGMLCCCLCSWPVGQPVSYQYAATSGLILSALRDPAPSCWSVCTLRCTVKLGPFSALRVLRVIRTSSGTCWDNVSIT